MSVEVNDAEIFNWMSVNDCDNEMANEKTKKRFIFLHSDIAQYIWNNGIVTKYNFWWKKMTHNYHTVHDFRKLI